MSAYDHRDKRALAELRQDLETLSTLNKAAAVLLAMRAGLFIAPPPIRVAHKLVRFVYGPANGTARAATGMARRFPRVVDDLWNDLMRHMTDGRNADDPTSAGAWNRRDLNIFLDIVGKLGWAPPAERRTLDP